MFKTPFFQKCIFAHLYCLINTCLNNTIFCTNERLTKQQLHKKQGKKKRLFMASSYWKIKICFKKMKIEFSAKSSYANYKESMQILFVIKLPEFHVKRMQNHSDFYRCNIFLN